MIERPVKKMSISIVEHGWTQQARRAATASLLLLQVFGESGCAMVSPNTSLGVPGNLR